MLFFFNIVSVSMYYDETAGPWVATRSDFNLINKPVK